MAGIFVNQALKSRWTADLSDWSSFTQHIALINSAGVPGLVPTETYAGISPSLNNILVLSAAAWGYTAVGNTMVAQQTIQWNFDSTHAGEIYYGYAIYGIGIATGANELMYYELFGTPYTVPVGGGILSVTPVLTKKDCST